MSAFTGSLVIAEVIPGRRWRLVEPLKYEAGLKGSGLLIEVPAGFETDGATIPAALRVVLAVWGTYGRAAAVHDFLYTSIRTARRDDYGRVVWRGGNWWPEEARRWSDTEFWLAMQACGTPRPLAWTMWAAVRLFGWRCIRPDA